jgi:peptidyl-prolyl cis-trans isomerase B (cyclophilin B)
MILLSGCSPNEGPADPSSSSQRPPASQESEPAPTSTGTSAAAAPGECAFTPTPGEAPARPVQVPVAQNPAPTTGKLTLKTNNGDITLTLDGVRAPCTTQSMLHLAAAKYFDGSPCHRLVSSETFRILQCGDPTGQGSGGPGYTIPDELPTGLAAAPNGGSVYPRGVVAMANTGRPNSGGSQFFLVFGDTFLAPDYTIFGTIDEAGLTVLDAIGAAGDDGSSSAGGGAPAMATTITQAIVG